MDRGEYILAPYSRTTDATEYTEPSLLNSVESARPCDILLQFIGHCTGHDNKVGKRMRLHVATAIEDECRAANNHNKLNNNLNNLRPCGDVIVECMDKKAETRISHAAFIRDLSRTSFCLVTPGDSQSSRRLTEVMLAMCIPVFLGPPFHTIPFASKVPYRELGVFFEMGDAELWLGDNTLREEGAEEWWPDDIDLSDVTVRLASSKQIVSYLRAIPVDVVNRMRTAVGAARSRFLYRDRMGDPPAASDTIAELLCHRTVEGR